MVCQKLDLGSAIMFTRPGMSDKRFSDKPDIHYLYTTILNLASEFKNYFKTIKQLYHGKRTRCQEKRQESTCENS